MNLGLIGCGQVAGLFHIPAIREVPQVSIEAITDVNGDQVERFGRRNGIEKRYTNYHSMFAECDIDSVLVCTPPRTHSQIVLDAIDWGLHILCEKPFVSSVSELDAIVRSVDEGLVVFPAHNYVFTPSLRLMEDLMKSGDLGDLIKAEAHLAVGFNTWQSKTDYRTQDPAGVIPDLLYHVIYVVSRLCGPLTSLSRVEAEKGNNHVVSRVRVEGEFKSAASAKLSASWKALLPHFKITLYFSSSEIGTDLIWNPYIMFAKGVKKELLPKPLGGRLAEARALMSKMHPSFRLLHQNFLDSVTVKARPEVTIRHAEETLQTIQAIADMAGI